jgi:SAM-dependent methyltransferase
MGDSELFCSPTLAQVPKHPEQNIMVQTINKRMDRDDLLSADGRQFVEKLSRLSDTLDERRLPVTSWYGGLPEPKPELSLVGIKGMAKQILGRNQSARVVGEVNRGRDSYEPVPGIRDDDRHPWFLYWEAYWVMTRGPETGPRKQVLDAGGTASLFSSYLASQGPEVHSVDLNEKLVAAGNEISRGMEWNMRSHCMNMVDLQFDDGYFDHAYSICVFEHLYSELRQRALREIARVLKPGGILSITFDYRGPGVSLAGQGPNYDPENLIQTPEDVHRHFFSSGCFEPFGNPDFEDNGKSYLIWPGDESKRYTFGAVFLRKPS